MRTGGRVLLSLFVLLLLLPEAHAQPKQTGSRFLKGRLLVKYTDSLTECAHCLLKDRAKFQDATSDRSDSLDRLHAKYRVKGAKPVFRSDAEESKLTQRLGRRLRLADLRFHHQQKLNAAVRRRSPQLARARRARVDLAPIYVLELDETLDVAAVASEYAKDPHVAYAHPDYLLQADFVPNDPYYSSSNSWGQGYADLWGLKKIQPELAWDQTQGSGIIVAVVDTGVDTGHPDLAANIQAGGSDFSTCAQLERCPLPPAPCPGELLPPDAGLFCRSSKPRDAIPEDEHGHGTHVAGIIAAVGNNNQGIIGVAPQAKILPIKALGALDSEGRASGLTRDVADAIVYAADQGAHVINLSLGDCQVPVPGALPRDIPTLTLAVNHAVVDHGVVVVASAGNDAIDIRHCTPANLSNVITVGASNQDDHRTYFSNVGWKLDVLAPGGGWSDETLPNILSLRSRELSPQRQSQLEPRRVGTDYLLMQGTSQAAPHVSGLAALLIAKHTPGFTTCPAAGSTWCWQDIKSAIRLGADDLVDRERDIRPGCDYYTGCGRINLLTSLNQTKRVILSATVVSHNLAATVDEFGNPQDITGILTIRVTNEWNQAVGVQGTLSLNPTLGDILTTTYPNPQVIGTLPQGAQVEVTYQIKLFSPTDGARVPFTVQFLGSNFSLMTIPLEIKLELPPAASWPFYTGGSVFSSPVIVDLDPASPGLEVVFGSMNGQVYALKADGSHLSGWPQTGVANVIQNTGIFSSPAVGDVDGDGDLEVIIGTADWNTDDPLNPYAFGQVYVWNHDGSLLGSYSIPNTQLKSTPALGNLDTDAAREVVVVAEDGQVHVFNDNGMELSGWPQPTGNSIPDIAMPSPAIAQLDGIGPPEVVVASSDGQVFAWQATGSPVNGWASPKLVSGSIEAPPAIGDLDGDGSPEIIVGSGNNCDGPASSGTVSIWRANGQPYGVPVPFPDCIRSSPAIGYLDTDPQREFVVATSNGIVCAFNHDSLLWPCVQADGPITSSPALADLNGDGQEEVAVGTLVGSLFVWDGQTGTLHGQTQSRSRFPLHIQDYQPQDRGAFGIQSSPAVGDFDSDNKIELLVGADDGGLYRFDFPGLASGSQSWPMFRQNAQRTGFLVSANRPPVLNAPESVPGTGGQALQFNVSASDPEGAPLTWGLGAVRQGDLVGVLGDVDGNGYINFDDEVRIAALVGQPVVPGETARADVNRSGAITIADIFDAVMAFGVSPVPPNFFNVQTGVIAWTPTRRGGRFPITVMVSDSELWTSKTVQLDVASAPPPVLRILDPDVPTPGNCMLPGPPDCTEDGSVAVGDIFAVAGAFGKTNVLPDWSFYEPYDLTGDGAVAIPDIFIVAQNFGSSWPSPTNPTASPTLSEGKLLQFYVKATHPEGLPLTYSAENLPAEACFNETRADGTRAPEVCGPREFRWTPTTMQAGSYPVSLSASDGDLSDTKPITITVTNVNQPPILNNNLPIGDRSATVGSPLSFEVWASDPDGGSVELRVSSALPANASFPTITGTSPISQTFSWTPTAAQLGPHSVIFMVTDPAGLFDTEPITITVTPNLFNQAPILNNNLPIAPKSVTEGSELSFTVSAIDPNFDPLTLTAQLLTEKGEMAPLPEGASFTFVSPGGGSATGTFTWTPTAAQAGSYTVVFTASDGNLSDTEPVFITVSNLPLAITSLTDSPDPFSPLPITPGVNDTTTISASFNQPVTSWMLSVKIGGVGGVEVRRFTYSGSGVTSLDQIWDGTFGLPFLPGTRAPSGMYTYVLTVNAPKGGGSVVAVGTVMVQ